MKIIVPLPFLGHSSSEAEGCAFPGSKINSWVHLTSINTIIALGTMAQTFISAIGSKRQVGLSEFKVSLTYKVSSRAARAK